MSNKGFSLMEILVSLILLAGVMAGIAGTIFAGKYGIIHSRDRMSGGELGKFFLDPIQMDVRQDTWNVAGNKMCVGTSAISTVKIDNVDYTGQSTVNSLAGKDLRQVIVNINWTE